MILEFKGTPPVMVSIQEPRWEKDVIDRPPSGQENYPERARDLMTAHHDVLKGIETNTVLGNAFKVLEELARQ